jgi:hypothetical protein
MPLLQLLLQQLQLLYKSPAPTAGTIVCLPACCLLQRLQQDMDVINVPVCLRCNVQPLHDTSIPAAARTQQRNTAITVNICHSAAVSARL